MAKMDERLEKMVERYRKGRHMKKKLRREQYKNFDAPKA